MPARIQNEFPQFGVLIFWVWSRCTGLLAERSIFQERHLFLLFFSKNMFWDALENLQQLWHDWNPSCQMVCRNSFVSDSDVISHFRGVRCLTILYGKSHDVEWNAWICCALEVEMSWYSQKPNLYVTVWNCMYLYVTVCNCMFVCTYVCTYVCMYVCLYILYRNVR